LGTYRGTALTDSTKLSELVTQLSYRKRVVRAKEGKEKHDLKWKDLKFIPGLPIPS
jgi:hypothetical protein